MNSEKIALLASRVGLEFPPLKHKERASVVSLVRSFAYGKLAELDKANEQEFRRLHIQYARLYQELGELGIEAEMRGEEMCVALARRKGAGTPYSCWLYMISNPSLFGWVRRK